MFSTVESYIPYCPLTESRKEEIESVLRSSNLVLKSYADMVPEMKRTDILAAISRGQRKFGEAVVTEEDARAILRTKSLEMEVLRGYSRMIGKFVNRWARRNEASISADDLSSEAVACALNAIAHFTREDTRLSTFLVDCVQNGLARFTDMATGMSYDSLKLKREYEKKLAKEGATFDSVVREMNITERQVKALQATLVSVTSESSLGEDETFQPRDRICMPDEDVSTVREIIKSISLSQIERMAVNAVMSSPSGGLGLSKSCKGMVNPSTNKPYTRAALSNAWLRAKKKIGEAMGA